MSARRATASRHIVAFSKQLAIMLKEARLGKPGIVLRCMTALDTLVEYADLQKMAAVLNCRRTQ